MGYKLFQLSNFTSAHIFFYNYWWLTWVKIQLQTPGTLPVDEASFALIFMFAPVRGISKSDSLSYESCLFSPSDILRMDSTNGDALYVRGLCLYYEDCIDKAVQFFVQALRMAPDHEKSRLACRVSHSTCACTYFKMLKWFTRVE